jgi:membrane protein
VLFSILKSLGFQNKEAKILLQKLTAGSELAIIGILSYTNNTSIQTLGSILLQPIFITVAIGVTAGNILTLDFVKALLAYPLIEFLISSFLPYHFMWISFTLMYYFLVNHKVPFLAAFVGGIVAGTTWQIGQEFYIHFSHTVNRYNIIYGSFAQLILVFLWLYISWIIILAGMELVYAIVNYRAYQKEGKHTIISPSFKEKLVLIVMAIIVRRFKHGKPPISAEGILKMTNAPRRAVYDLLQELKDLMLVMESEQNGIKVYTPGMDTELLTVPHVLKLVREYGVNHVPILDEEEGKKVDKLMRDINVLLEKNFNAVKISDF